MKILDNIKEKVATDAGYKSIEDKKGNTSAWFTLLNDVKGDEELIDFYTSICMNTYADLQLERVQSFICVLQSDIPIDRESILKLKTNK